uniref:WD repeat domain 4 n=1 Tax=Dicentrarchus labrax TaxID=13489 RepID=A0A8P4KP71_DICLA
MAAAGFCGSWFVFSCDSKLVAVHSKQRQREPFVFDCGAAERTPRSTKDDDNSGGGAPEETGSDRVLAFTASPSGKLVALTDDNKRLVLLHCEPSWRCISVRSVARRCTSLLFSRAEDELLAADKSGDVYSFSVAEPQREGELKMGHLSMLLAVTMSPDDKYIITADRDEKIRVSHRRSPYNIQSFCLGHQEFVSALLIPSGHPRWLLSGSGDGTVKLWEFESGRKLQSWDLRELEETVSAVQFFTVEQEGEEKLVPHSRLALPHCPLDVTFDPEGRLWVLMDSSEMPLRVYTHRRDSWECAAESPELHTVTEAVRPHWETLEVSARTSSRFEHLHKVTFDNVTAYLQKKQQRLEEQQLKRTKAPKANGNKKARKETADTPAST